MSKHYAGPIEYRAGHSSWALVSIEPYEHRVASYLRAYQPELFYQAVKNSDPLDWSDRVGSKSISTDDLDFLQGLSPGDHHDAIRWLKEFGEFNSTWGTEPVDGDTLPGHGYENEGVFPAQWWAEALWLRRARWLHSVLLNVEQDGNEFSRACEQLCSTYQFPNDEENGFLAGRVVYDGIRWPKEHVADWLDLTNSDSGWLYGKPHDETPEVYLWARLAGIVDDGLRRYRIRTTLEYDRQTARVRETAPSKSPSLGAACWELLRLELLNERPPIRCELCGDLVRPKRSTKRQCGKPRCKKRAWRARKAAEARSNEG